MADFGYDVANYTDVDPLFGDLAAFDRLLAEAHRRGIRVVMDLVFNHSSDQHPWFRQSRAGRENPKRDWYIWRDGRGPGKPPNNWQSVFGGPAWTFDPASGQWYLHMFLPQQPDLNWRNPDVREALLAAARFWLERGVDGFRLDVFNLWFKDAAPPAPPGTPRHPPASPGTPRHLRPGQVCVRGRCASGAGVRPGQVCVRGRCA
ncbi:MAG: hypothetical protein HY784_15510, partial [Chloroflexi bacterium]|nr:hypothetical protein [Chloroflexota bacterium]